MKKCNRAWIEYSYPDPDDAAIIEVWHERDGDFPKKKKAKYGCVFEYDIIPSDKAKDGELVNERLWSGEL